MLELLHLGEISAGAPDWDCDERFRQFEAGFRALPSEERHRIEMIIISGGITANGLAEEFEEAAKFVDMVSNEVFPPTTPRRTGVRIFPVPSLADVNAGYRLDFTEFEKFQRCYVPKLALLGAAGPATPYVLKLRKLSLIGLRPVDSHDALAAASSQLKRGIKCLEDFCFRGDAVPKIVVSSGAELGFGDDRGHSDFHDLCKALRKGAPLDLHLFTYDRAKVVGPRPFGMPIPSVAAGSRPAHVDAGPFWINLIGFDEKAEGAGYFCRKTFLKSLPLSPGANEPLPSGRAGQALQYYDRQVRPPDFAQCLKPVLDDVRHAIFEEAKWLISVEGMQGSGKRLLFEELKKGKWLPQAASGHQILSMTIDGEDICWPEIEDTESKPILLIRDENWGTLRGVNSAGRADELSKKFVALQQRCKAVIYLFVPGSETFATGFDMLIPLSRSISLSKIERTDYENLAHSIGGLVEIDSKFLLSQMGGQIEILGRMYDSHHKIARDRDKTTPISPSQEQRLLEQYAKLPDVEKAANRFVESLELFHSGVGKRLIELVREQRPAGGRFPSSVTLRRSELAYTRSTMQGRAIDKLVTRLDEYGIIEDKGEELVISAPFPFFAARPKQILNIFIFEKHEGSSVAGGLEMAIGLVCRRNGVELECKPIDQLRHAEHVLLSKISDPALLAAACEGVRDWIDHHGEAFSEGRSFIFVRQDVASLWKAGLGNVFIEDRLVEIDGARDEDIAIAVIEKLEANDDDPDDPDGSGTQPPEANL